MYFTIYKVTNKINGKVYIGKHQTNNLNDSYMGSGKQLYHAYKKYGIENFTKEILFILDSEEEMNMKEKELVTEEFCKRKDTYNICIGGKGGFSYINSNNLVPLSAKINGGKKGGLSERSKLNLRIETEYKTQARRKNIRIATEYAKTPEASEKRKTTFKSINHQQGEKNSQFGTCWITNGITTIKINKENLDYYLNNGYSKGRKLIVTVP